MHEQSTKQLDRKLWINLYYYIDIIMYTDHKIDITDADTCTFFISKYWEKNPQSDASTNISNVLGQKNTLSHNS